MTGNAANLPPVLRIEQGSVSLEAFRALGVVAAEMGCNVVVGTGQTVVTPAAELAPEPHYVNVGTFHEVAGDVAKGTKAWRSAIRVAIDTREENGVSALDFRVTPSTDHSWSFGEANVFEGLNIWSLNAYVKSVRQRAGARTGGALKRFLQDILPRNTSIDMLEIWEAVVEHERQKLESARKTG